MTGIISGLITKTQWSAGPWFTEGDFASWRDEESNFPCVLYRGASSGAWWGSVGIPDAASHYHRGTLINDNVHCHWGPSATGPYPFVSDEDGQDERDPRILAELKAVISEYEGYLWFTFACTHVGDYCPGYVALWRDLDFEKAKKDYEGSYVPYKFYYMKEVHSHHPGNYKDFEFAKAECKKLAMQLVRVKEDADWRKAVLD